MSVFQAFHSGSWRGFVHQNWQETLSDLDLWLQENPGHSIVAQKNRRVSRVETPAGVLYVKQMYRLQKRGPTWKMLLTGIKWYLRPSRAIAVLNISNSLKDKGIACPEPVLAARRRNACGWPEDLFISREIPEPTLLSLFDSQENAQEHKARIAHAARGIAALHKHGFIHGDCIPGNLCLTADHSLVFLDNDRTRHTTRFRKRRAQMDNLIQFLSRLPTELQQEEVFTLFLDEYQRHYGQLCPINAHNRPQLIKRLQKRLDFLAAKDARKAQN
jgi:tRNA A-37 threonylcarbamoyl transferase component Bud32